MSYYRAGLALDTHPSSAMPFKISGYGMAIGNHAYRAGLDDRPVRVGALVATPSYLKDQIKMTDGEIISYDKEIASQAGLPGYGSTPNATLTKWWSDNWSPFMQSWSSYRNKHDGSDASIYIENFWGSGVWSTLQDYRAKFSALVDTAKKAGFSFDKLAPPSAPEKDLAGKAEDLAWTALKIVLIAGIAFIIVSGIAHGIH